ncbi:MAG: hypothetical protein WD598_02785 [Acidimicrobiia bacterium]
MPVNFTQIISFRCEHPEQIVELAAAWDENQAAADIMGYIGSHVLADRENPGEYLLVAEFGIVDPDVPAAEEATRNNDRPETQLWHEKLLAVLDGEPMYRHFDEIYRTG